MLINENKRTVLCNKANNIRVGIFRLNYKGGGNNIFDFPSLFFHVDDQWNTRQKLGLVSCVCYGGGGGGGGKTMEMW